MQASIVHGVARSAAKEYAGLEALATEPQGAFARALLAIWLKKVAE